MRRLFTIFCSANKQQLTAVADKTIGIFILGLIVTIGFYFVVPSKADYETLNGKPRYIKTVKVISTKYKRDPKEVEFIVNQAVSISESKDIDPVLTLAVIATESEFNPQAYNRSSGASGLTQVLTGLHKDRIEAYRGSIFDPLVAIHVGTDLIYIYRQWAKGNLKQALSTYGGDSSDRYYNKVMDNYRWINETVERKI